MLDLKKIEAAATAPVVLIRESVNDRGEKCPAGMAIAPDVDGWPLHRVKHHLITKLAEPGNAKPVLPAAAPAPAPAARKPAPAARDKGKGKGKK